ncbi:MAG: cytochrome b5 domain-containing protein [Pelovirga sp.]|jgi:predicted heme/steroid binding protein
MTREELSGFDGRHGNPAYVAVSGIIYDVTKSGHWQDGNHEGAHQAGQDLTEELKSAPHVRAVIERFPTVGQLSPEPPPAPRASRVPLLPIAIVAALAIALIALLLR